MREPAEVIAAYVGYSRWVDGGRFVEVIEVNGERLLTIDLSLPEKARREWERRMWHDWINQP